MKKILDIIETSDEFNDSVYNYLIIKFGKNTVDEVITNLLRNKDINTKVYKKLIGYSSKKCFKVTNSIYINVLSEIIRELDSIFISIGCKNNYRFLGKLMYLKVEYAIGKCNDRETIIKIKLLYEQFIAIRNKIFNSNLGLIDRVMKKFSSDSDADGLYQEATFGLMRACEKYDSTRGAFSTFADNSIYYAIINHFYDGENYFYMRRDIIFEYASFVKINKEFYDEYGYYPSDEEIVSKSRLSLDSVRLYRLIYSYNNRDITIDNNILIDDEKVPIIENYYNERLENDDVEETIFNNELCSIMKELVDDLPERCRKVIKGIYYEDRGSSSLAKEMHITISRVWAIHNAALSKIRRNRVKLKGYY